MASRKREAVGVVTAVDGDAVEVALDMRSEAARGMVVDLGIAGSAAVDAAADAVNAVAESIAVAAAIDPPLSVAAQTWRVVERAWVDGRRVVARDPSGALLTGLSRDEARGYARARPAEVEAEPE